MARSLQKISTRYILVKISAQAQNVMKGLQAFPKIAQVRQIQYCACTGKYSLALRWKVPDVLHLSRKTMFQISKSRKCYACHAKWVSVKQRARRARKTNPSEGRSAGNRFVRDFCQKQNMKELSCCKCHQKCRTRIRPPGIDTDTGP